MTWRHRKILGMMGLLACIASFGVSLPPLYAASLSDREVTTDSGGGTSNDSGAGTSSASNSGGTTSSSGGSLLDREVGETAQPQTTSSDAQSSSQDATDPALNNAAGSPTGTDGGGNNNNGNGGNNNGSGGGFLDSLGGTAGLIAGFGMVSEVWNAQQCKKCIPACQSDPSIAARCVSKCYQTAQFCAPYINGSQSGGDYGDEGYGGEDSYGEGSESFDGSEDSYEDEGGEDDFSGSDDSGYEDSDPEASGNENSDDDENNKGLGSENDDKADTESDGSLSEREDDQGGEEGLKGDSLTNPEDRFGDLGEEDSQDGLYRDGGIGGGETGGLDEDGVRIGGKQEVLVAQEARIPEVRAPKRAAFLVKIWVAKVVRKKEIRGKRAKQSLKLPEKPAALARVILR